MERNGNFHWIQRLILMSKQVSKAAHINHILKMCFLCIDSESMLSCLTQMCLSNIWWEESHPWRLAVLRALRMDLHWGLGQGCLILAWYSLNGLIWLQGLEEKGHCQKQKIKYNESIYWSTMIGRKLCKLVSKFCWQDLEQWSGTKGSSFQCLD